MEDNYSLRERCLHPERKLVLGGGGGGVALSTNSKVYMCLGEMVKRFPRIAKERA